MGKPVAGDVVIIPFPQTELKVGKARPVLVLVDLLGDDLILCQITSQAKSDAFSIALNATDFARGNLPLASYVRPNRLFTVDQAVIIRTAGRVKPAKLQETLAAARKILT
ncbi:MAG: type II toxin-antitoxin system PemK/MazF family toxin [Planctomycetaceae bacterium]|nr:type II toxin-antitoxin system PemK/MazF family toxin [Planctomycetaceae bacterium]